MIDFRNGWLFFAALMLLPFAALAETDSTGNPTQGDPVVEAAGKIDEQCGTDLSGTLSDSGPLVGASELRREKNPGPAEPEFWVSVSNYLSRHPEVLDKVDRRTRNRVAACAGRVFTVDSRRAREAAAGDPGSAEAAEEAAAIEPVREVFATLIHQVTLDEPQASFFIGPNFSLQGDGGLEAGGIDVLFRYEGGKDSFIPGGRGFTEISYQKIKAIDAPAGDDEAEAGAAAEDGEDEAPENPFASEQGFFRINSGATFFENAAGGLLIAAGLSSIDSGADSAARLEPRAVAGLNFRRFLTDGTYSQFIVGYAYDQFWEYEESNGKDAADKPIIEQRKDFDRAIIDATIYFPGVRTGELRAALRLFIDTPLSGHGPSDVRLSVLTYFSVNGFLELLDPLLMK